MSRSTATPPPEATAPRPDPLLSARTTRGLLAAGALVLLAALLWRGADARAEAALVRADPETMLADPALAAKALSLGHTTFVRHCASCHGASGGADPVRGVPSLRDAERLYGEGRVADIESIVRHGIRAGDRKGWNLAEMPAYASARPYAAEPIPPLTPRGVADTTQFLLSLSGRADDRAAAQRGAGIYAGPGGCWDCHGADARGDPAVGAPNLTDGIWLYGYGDAPTIARSLEYGRAGVSPAFGKVLDAAEMRAVAVYVASLSAGSNRQARR